MRYPYREPLHREATAVFCKTARLMGHKPITRRANSVIGVWLKDGRDIPALAIYEDDLGNWVMLNENGKVHQYTHDEVV